MYRVRSKHPGSGMGSWKYECSEVRINNTASPDGQERDTEGLSYGRVRTFHKNTHWSFCSQLTSIYRRSAMPKGSVSYPVDWQPTLAKRAPKTNRDVIFGYL